MKYFTERIRTQCVPYGNKRKLEAVEHPVDDHAGNGHVKPKGQSPAGDALVAFEISFERAKEREQDQGYDHRCENRVGNEDRKIYPADPTLALERHRADLEVVGEIRDEKQGRGREGREHEKPVCPDLSAPDE